MEKNYFYKGGIHMGASNYRSTSSTSSTHGTRGRRRNYTQEKTQMERMIEKMREVEERKKQLEEARENLETAEEEYAQAREEVRRSEAEVMKQIDQLDPETQDILRRMLGRLEERDGNSIER